jgi:hypothetical protein
MDDAMYYLVTLATEKFYLAALSFAHAATFVERWDQGNLEDRPTATLERITEEAARKSPNFELFVKCGKIAGAGSFYLGKFEYDKSRIGCPEAMLGREL